MHAVHNQLNLPVQIVHLDIKSSNILLTRGHPWMTAKVSDVGIAKAMSSSEGVVLTQVRCARLVLMELFTRFHFQHRSISASRVLTSGEELPG